MIHVPPPCASPTTHPDEAYSHLNSTDNVLLRSEGGDGILAWDDIQHFVVIPNYKEDIDTLYRRIQCRLDEHAKKCEDDNRLAAESIGKPTQQWQRERVNNHAEALNVAGLRLRLPRDDAAVGAMIRAAPLARARAPFHPSERRVTPLQ